MTPKQPFYVDVGTSVVAIRCASNHDVIERYDHVRHPHTLELAKDICDRMNREVAIHNSGDCAKLREALEPWIAFAEWLLKNAGNDALGVAIRDNGPIIRQRLEELRAALAAPLRNCDMPLVVDGPADNNADKAWLVFKRHNPDAYFDVPGLLRCIDWLLAPATEKEGGAK